MKTTPKKLKAQLLRRDKPPQPGEPWLSSGSTLLNLACSGRTSGGFPAGGYVFLVGDSASGKTFLSLTCLAEAAVNKAFKDYRFVYDGPEGGAQMDLERYFGKAMVDRLEYDSHSATVQDFYYHLDDCLKDEKPFVYVLDSMDALGTDEELEHFAETKKASRNGKAATGSYGVSKAKANSTNIRLVISRLRQTKSILIVISQTRDNLGFGFEKKTRSGGNALRFYADLEIWSSVKGKIRKHVNGKDRQLGIWVQVAVKKNRLTGREGALEVPIYWSSGMDDTGSCVRWLVEEGRWKKDSKGKVEATDFDFTGTEESLVRKIEEDGSEVELRAIVAQVWKEIEDACKVSRKARYG